MNVMQNDKSVSREIGADGRFSEKWMAGTYVVAGIFEERRLDEVRLRSFW